MVFICIECKCICGYKVSVKWWVCIWLEHVFLRIRTVFSFSILLCFSFFFFLIFFIQEYYLPFAQYFKYICICILANKHSNALFIFKYFYQILIIVIIFTLLLLLLLKTYKELSIPKHWRRMKTETSNRVETQVDNCTFVHKWMFFDLSIVFYNIYGDFITSNRKNKNKIVRKERTDEQQQQQPHYKIKRRKEIVTRLNEMGEKTPNEYTSQNNC